MQIVDLASAVVHAAARSQQAQRVGTVAGTDFDTDFGIAAGRMD